MGETIEIQAADGVAEAYLTGEAGRPGVLLYIDAIGLRPRIEEMADRIASWGYVVLAPNVFYRDGRAAELAPRTDLRDPQARAAFFADGATTTGTYSLPREPGSIGDATTDEPSDHESGVAAMTRTL